MIAMSDWVYTWRQLNAPASLSSGKTWGSVVCVGRWLSHGLPPGRGNHVWKRRQQSATPYTYIALVREALIVHNVPMQHVELCPCHRIQVVLSRNTLSYMHTRPCHPIKPHFLDQNSENDLSFTPSNTHKGIGTPPKEQKKETNTTTP